MQIELTWCVSRAKPFARWHNFFYIFTDNETHMLATSAFTTVVIAVFLTTAFESKPLTGSEALLLCIQILEANPTNFNPKKTSVRFLFMWGVFCALVIDGFFLAFFLDNQTRQFFNEQIASIDAIIECGYDLAGPEFLLEPLKEGFSVELMKTKFKSKF